MKNTFIAVTVMLTAGLWASQAAAWGSANRFGGSTAHALGEGTEHTNRWGGSTEHAWGGGTEHTNVYGGSTEGRYGDGAEHTNMYGGSTEARYGEGAEHTNMYGGTTEARYGEGAYHTTYYGATAPVYPAYHAPVAVPYYSASGCYGCAAAAGAVVGMATGAAVASSEAAATTSAYNAGVAAGASSATTSVYNAGVAAGAASASGAAVPASGNYVMGVNYASLPNGCKKASVDSGTYYLCGNAWFKPAFGANGVYYRVVPAP